MQFTDFNLNTNILEALEKMKFVTPTDIQNKAIPMLMKKDTDLIARAQTGTGKTAAFGIPLLHKINPSLNSIQAVILSPTRELAAQLKTEIDKLSNFTNIKSVLVMGGAAYDSQKRNIKQGKPHILIGTPGRVLDLIEQRVIRLQDAKYLVLDEADEMLNVGFFEAVQTVIKSFEQEKQMWMFSATMPRNIIRLIKEHFNNPEIIEVDKKESTNLDIEQHYYVVRQRYFQEALSRLMQVEPKMYAMVFCKTKADTKSLGENLISQGLKVETLHGDMAQSQRDLSMQRFKSKKVQMMICTDVAARGIDIKDLTHVINLGLPQNSEAYVHRIGRTGRAGKKGTAITLLDPRDYYKISGLERFINKKIIHSKLPTTTDLKTALVSRETKGIKSVIEAVQERKHSFKIDSNFKTFKEGFEDLSSEEILKVAFTWFFNGQIKHLDSIGNLDATDMASQRNNTFGRMSRDRNRGGGGGDRNRGGGGGGGGNRRRRFSKSNSSDGDNQGRRFSKSNSSDGDNQGHKPFVHRGPFGKAKKTSSEFSKTSQRSRGF
ncbi:MAG: DEAD/DEAH box helicase [Bdellovibrionales bacterium]|nr:DEAD/DEAH box helicase [Bdellovibrionales bacterium]